MRPCLAACSSLTALLALGGCANPCDVPDDELTLVAVVTDNGETVRAELELESAPGGGPPRSWQKCEEDVILVNGEEARETEHDGRFEYAVTFTDPANAPRAFTFEIEREGADAPLTATTELPTPFEIVRPAPGQSLSRASSVVLEWMPPVPEGVIQINLVEEVGEGICLQTNAEEHDYKGKGGVRVTDDGAWTIPPATVSSSGGGSCDAQYLLRRFAEGEYPEALAAGGFVEARVIRSLPFISTP